jgi:hypothetical protein
MLILVKTLFWGKFEIKERFLTLLVFTAQTTALKKVALFLDISFWKSVFSGIR